MGMTPLTTTQHHAIDGLVDAHRLSAVLSDVHRATTFIRNAQRALADVPNLTEAQNRYNLSYDACHDVGEALLAAYGYRTANGRGQHEAVGQYLRAVLTAPPGSTAAKRFDQLRRGRNQQRYTASIVGEADADVAEKTARELIAAALESGIEP